MRPASLMRVVFGCVTVTILGCIAPPSPTGMAPSLAVELSVLDAQSVDCDRQAVPRRPEFVLETELGFATDGPAPLLFEGPADADLVADLDRMPLTAFNAHRLISCSVHKQQHTAIHVVPNQALARGTIYTLAVPRNTFSTRARNSSEHAWTQTLRTADSPLAGAAVQRAFPADGSLGVPIDLEFAVLAFDGSVEGIDSGVWLEDDAGWSVPAEISNVSCAALESGADTCVRVKPIQPLAPLSRYTLQTGRALHDAHGAAIDAFAAGFWTADGSDSQPVTWSTAGCALDELELPIGCALVEDERIELHLRPREPARIVVQLAEFNVARLVASGAGLEVAFGDLTPSTSYPLRVDTHDALGRSQRFDLSLTTLDDLPKLSISEVRADPLGSEPAQEYVELLNFGTQPIALAGFALSDSSDQLGTLLEDSGPQLPPGARALLVADAFDNQDPLDVPAAPGTLLVHVGTTLTRAGLSNSGEALFLRDRERRRVSAAPADPTPRAGVCSARVSADPRSGTPGTFAYDPDGSCTPGR